MRGADDNEHGVREGMNEGGNFQASSSLPRSLIAVLFFFFSAAVRTCKAYHYEKLRVG
jgi:hypothetical protein